MKGLSIVRIASRSLSRNKVRTTMMMLGVMIGIASFTILTSVGESTKRETIKRFKNMLGTFDTVIVRPGAGHTKGMVSLTNVDPTLKFDDAQAIANEVREIKQVAEVQNAFDINVKYRDRTGSPAVFGVSSNWLELRGDQVAEGEFFSANDQNALARSAILGVDVKDSLFPDQKAIGKTILIGNVPFQVKGILTQRGAGPAGGSLDNIILIPVTTASKRLFNRDFMTMLIAQLRNPQESDKTITEITQLLRDRHHLSKDAINDFTVTDPRAVMAQILRVGNILRTLLIGLAIAGIGIGGVVILSLTMISVSERRMEIGIRRSVGASRTDILVQFVTECIVVVAVGGLAGIILGIGGTQAISRLQHVPFLIEQQAVLFSVVLSAFIGIAFGIYPALRAAKTDPVLALRI